MKKIFSLLLILVLLGSLSLTAFAREVPDLSRTGTITLTFSWDDKPLDSGSLCLYRVGDILLTDGNDSFVLVEALADSGLSLENLQNRELAQNLARQAQDLGLTPIQSPIQGGKAVFSVTPGLYVAVQKESEAADGFAPISPFLISLPQYQNGGYVYDITAQPKVPLETEPPETTLPQPTLPPDPQLPQTGQLNWPVPLLAAAGMLLFLAGWFLRFGRKDSHET